MTNSLACPGCGALLSQHCFGTTKVQVCKTGCHGLWFDADTLDKIDHAEKGIGHNLEAALSAEPRPAAAGRVLDCPSCLSPMDVVRHEQIKELQLDSCGSCEGIFLDAGELAQLRVREWTVEERRELFKRKKRRRTRQKRFAQSRKDAMHGDLAIRFLVDAD